MAKNTTREENQEREHEDYLALHREHAELQATHALLQGRYEEEKRLREDLDTKIAGLTKDTKILGRDVKDVFDQHNVYRDLLEDLVKSHSDDITEKDADGKRILLLSGGFDDVMAALNSESKASVIDRLRSGRVSRTVISGDGDILEARRLDS